MKKETKDKLFEAWAYCDWQDKSTEFMLAYMADMVPSWDESDVADWMISAGSKGRSEWFKRKIKEMKKVVEIDACYECPYHAHSGKGGCSHDEEIVTLIREIPEDCPLDDPEDYAESNFKI